MCIMTAINHHKGYFYSVYNEEKPFNIDMTQMQEIITFVRPDVFSEDVVNITS